MIWDLAKASRTSRHFGRVADWSSAFQSQICHTAHSFRRLQRVADCVCVPHSHGGAPCPRAANEKTLLMCRKCLWSQSTYEPSIMHHHLIPVWDASLGSDPSHQVWRYTRKEVFPTWPHRFLPIFHFSAVNIPLREELEQLFTHKSPTATWQHPSQVFLPQSKAKDNPQRKPSGSFCVQMHPRHPGTRVFCRQPQSTQLVSPGLLTN